MQESVELTTNLTSCMISGGRHDDVLAMLARTQVRHHVYVGVCVCASVRLCVCA
jgi:hypothetical protein